MEKIKAFAQKHFFFLLIFFLAILLRILYFGHVDFSETAYVLQAKNLLAGEYDLTEPNFQTHMLRLPLLIVLAGIIEIFGISHYVIASVTVLSSLITLFIIYMIGLKIMDEKRALLALFLFAIFPLNVKYSSIFEVDIIISMLMGLCYLLHLKKEKGRRQYILIGCILGVGFFIKFFIVIIGAIITLELFLQKEHKNIFILWSCFFLTMSPFLIYHFFETGDPLYYVTRTKYEAVDYDIIHDDDTTFLYWMFNPFIKKPQQSLFNLYWILLVIFLYFSLKKREWRYYSLWIWLFLGYFLLEISSLVPATQRYLIIIEIPLILLAAQGIFEIENKKVFLYLMLLLFLTSIYQLGKPTLLEERNPTPEEHIANLIKGLELKDIYITHNNQVGYLNYYLDYQYNYSGIFGYRGPTPYSFYDLHFVKNLSEIHNAYVIIDYTLITESVDILNFYKEQNVSIEYLSTTPPPSYWHGIYGLTDENGTIIGGIWDVP